MNPGNLLVDYLPIPDLQARSAPRGATRTVLDLRVASRPARCRSVVGVTSSALAADINALAYLDHQELIGACVAAAPQVCACVLMPSPHNNCAGGGSSSSSDARAPPEGLPVPDAVDELAHEFCACVRRYLRGSDEDWGQHLSLSLSTLETAPSHTLDSVVGAPNRSRCLQA